MANEKKRIIEFGKYPNYKQLYINAFDKMLEAHPNKESHYNWQNGEEVFNWWLEIDENQMTLDELLEEGDFDGT